MCFDSVSDVHGCIGFGGSCVLFDTGLIECTGGVWSVKPLFILLAPDWLNITPQHQFKFQFHGAQEGEQLKPNEGDILA